MRCRQQGKPVIVASHLLQSMIEFPTPTRAEVRAMRSLPLSGSSFPHIHELFASERAADV